MRRKRRKDSGYKIDRRLLYGAVFLLVLVIATVNCTFLSGELIAGDPAAGSAIKEESVQGSNVESEEAQEDSSPVDDLRWAKVTDEPDPSLPVSTHPDYISLDVRDADLRDVLSLIAYKLDGNIIYLEGARNITIKTSQLTPITTLQTVLQKEGLDYLTVGRNYIVGERDRLYEDFANRMYLSRFNLFYVSASAMEGFIGDLDVPVESLTVDPNQQSLWMQGTPMALGKAREVINSLDVIENAAFAEGGSRHIRMPVAIATGIMSEDELYSLIDLLSILLDGFRDDRTDLGWGTWDHPGPVPRIYMDWSSPVIKPHDIKMKITPDLDPTPGRYLHYLVAEGTPANIDLVNEMIEEIRGTPETPFRFGGETEAPGPPVWPPDQEEDENNNNNNNNNQGEGGDSGQSSTPTQAYYVSLNAVPTEGGVLTGNGAYIQGASVTVTADPYEGYRFVRWIEEGVEVSINRTYSFSIYSNRNLEAVFINVPVESDSDPGDDSDEVDGDEEDSDEDDGNSAAGGEDN